MVKTYSTQIKSVILQLFSTYILTEYTYEAGVFGRIIGGKKL